MPAQTFTRATADAQIARKEGQPEQTGEREAGRGTRSRCRSSQSCGGDRIDWKLRFGTFNFCALREDAVFKTAARLILTPFPAAPRAPVALSAASGRSPRALGFRRMCPFRPRSWRTCSTYHANIGKSFFLPPNNCCLFVSDTCGVRVPIYMLILCAMTHSLSLPGSAKRRRAGARKQG